MTVTDEYEQVVSHLKGRNEGLQFEVERGGWLCVTVRSPDGEFLGKTYRIPPAVVDHLYGMLCRGT